MLDGAGIGRKCGKRRGTEAKEKNKVNAEISFRGGFFCFVFFGRALNDWSFFWEPVDVASFLEGVDFRRGTAGAGEDSGLNRRPSPLHSAWTVFYPV